MSASPRIAIVTDGSSDVPRAERIAAAGSAVEWTVLPERWVAAGVELLDEGEQARELTRMVLGGRPPQVEAPSVAAIGAAYDVHADADLVLSVHGAASMSDTVVRAREAASGRDNVVVVESAVIGIGAGLLAVRAASIAAQGAGPDAVVAYARRHAPGMHLLVVPDHFDPMAGRRIAAARLLAARPMLGTATGELAPHGRLRSRRQTVAAITGYIEQHAPTDRTLRMAVGHADAAGAVDPFLDIVERLRPDATIDLVGRVGPRVVQGIGARCVALAWIAE